MLIFALVIIIMIEKLYKTYYEKLPNSLGDVMPIYEGCKLVTYLNFYYMIKAKPENYGMYEHFDYITSDGITPLKLQKLLGHAKSVRLSPDMSSMMEPIIRDVMLHGESLYILGAKPDEVEKSVNTIKETFPGVSISGFHHGYIKDCKDEIANEIIKSGAKVALIGMGAPYQDEMAIILKNSGFKGTVYTCGGFIHQTQEGIISFPEWSNKLGLRWLYRIFTQKGVLRRIIQTLPKFLITYSWFLLFQNKQAKAN